MIRIYYLCFFFINLICGQILPTIPSNVFRITIGSDLSNNFKSNLKWSSGKQDFNLKGLGRHYFNNLQHNDSTRFSSNYDLYYNGNVLFDPNLEDAIPGSLTVENWMNKFNLEKNLNLPVFGTNGFDTSSVINIFGNFFQKQEKIVQYQNIKLDYGMSNEITLHINIPIIKEYTILNSIDSLIIGKVENANSLIAYHVNSKNEFSTFIGSNEFSNLSLKRRDTLQTIYDLYYSSNGEYSVEWVFHAQDDPINNILVDSRFFSMNNNDSIIVDSLIAFYYPNHKSAVNKDQVILDDITIGSTILLKGKPAWISEESLDALYGQFFVSIPFGPTISSFNGTNQQIKEIKIGSGVTRFSLGFFGSKKMKKNDNLRFYFQALFTSSTPEILNTPVSLFSGMHSHPDSILSTIGNTYKFDQGFEFNFKIGGEIELIKNKLLIKNNFLQRFKAKDRFVSKSSDWDNWMEEHSGYSSSYNYIDFNIEFWFINSFSKTRIVPFSFDAFIGLNKTLYVKNTFDGFNLYSGITTYFQGW